MLADIDVPAGRAQAQSAATQGGTVNALGGPFEVRELARTHGPDFRVFPGRDPLGIDANTTVERVGLNSKILRYRGHVGAHLAASFEAPNDRRPRRNFS